MSHSKLSTDEQVNEFTEALRLNVFLFSILLISIDLFIFRQAEKIKSLKDNIEMLREEIDFKTEQINKLQARDQQITNESEELRNSIRFVSEALSVCYFALK